MSAHPRHLPVFSALLLAVAVFSLAARTHAQEQPAPVRHGALTIEQVWARATSPKAKNGAAYLVIRNGGDRADTLLSVESAIAARTGLHESRMDGNIMRMRPLKGGVAVAPGKPALFRPGGFHIMLMGLKRPLTPGDEIALVLTFENAGPVTVTAMVRKSAPPMGTGGKMKMPVKQTN